MKHEDAHRKACLKHARQFLEKVRSTRIVPKWGRESINEVIELVDNLIEEPYECGPIVCKILRICRELHDSNSALNSKAKSWIETVILHLERAMPVVAISTDIPQSQSQTTPSQTANRPLPSWPFGKKVTVGGIAVAVGLVFGCIQSLGSLGWHPFDEKPIPAHESSVDGNESARPTATDDRELKHTERDVKPIKSALRPLVN